jgi:hypothetical protein
MRSVICNLQLYYKCGKIKGYEMDGAGRRQIHETLIDKQKERENFGDRCIDDGRELKLTVKRQGARIQTVGELS